MRVFILEDDVARMMWFRERLRQHDITHATTCMEASKFVAPYDLVCFDHDLGGRQMIHHEDNGEEFAKLVSEQIGTAFVLIHSYNPHGAKAIQSIFKRGVCAPFRSLLFTAILDRVVPR